MTLMRDMKLAMRVDVSSLIAALEHVRSRFDDAAIIEVNHQGNLAIRSPFARNADGTPAPNGVGLFYVGYIDMSEADHSQAVLVWENDLQSEQNPGSHPLTPVWSEQKEPVVNAENH